MDKVDGMQLQSRCATKNVQHHKCDLSARRDGSQVAPTNCYLGGIAPKLPQLTLSLRCLFCFSSADYCLTFAFRCFLSAPLFPFFLYLLLSLAASVARRRSDPYFSRVPFF